MAVEVREVVSRGDLKRFVRFPHALYRGNDCYVPALEFDELNTLRRDRNPAFEQCEARYWMAWRDGVPVGRVAGIVNRRYVELWKNRYARFGWLDFADDPEVCRTLLGAVEEWARGQGLTAVHGPLGFTDLDREGMLVEGFDQLGTLATNYNHPYYPRHLEACGYAKDADWVEFRTRAPAEVPEKVRRVAEIAAKRYKLRLLEVPRKKDVLRYAPELFAVLDEAYRGLYGVVPLSERQVAAYVKQYFGFVNPAFIKLVVDERGKLAGFLVGMPSLSRALQKCGGRLLPLGFLHLLRALRRSDTLDLYIAAVRPDLQGKGVNAIFVAAMIHSVVAAGVRWIESNPELETNQRVQSHWEYFESRQHRRRRCFIKNL